MNQFDPAARLCAVQIIGDDTIGGQPSPAAPVDGSGCGVTFAGGGGCAGCGSLLCSSRSHGEPVCTPAVVDNSYSVKKVLTKMQSFFTSFNFQLQDSPHLQSPCSAPTTAG